MALYIPHSIFHLARLLYVRPETFGPYYVRTNSFMLFSAIVWTLRPFRTPNFLIIKGILNEFALTVRLLRFWKSPL